MVKREHIKAGALVKVVKLMPVGSAAGPAFKGTLGMHERLEIRGTPISRGPMNLVSVKRRKTGEVVELIYAFITNYCKLVDAEEPELTPAAGIEPDSPPPKPDGA